MVNLKCLGLCRLKNAILQVEPLSEMASVACCRASLASGISVVVVMDWYRLVLSAYVTSPMTGGRMSWQSFTYRRNNVGTRMLPCRCPMPDHPPCQIIPHPLAQSASAPGSCKILYDSLFSTLRLAALIEWETEIRPAGEAVLFYLENDENNALRFSHGFAVDFETLK